MTKPFIDFLSNSSAAVANSHENNVLSTNKASAEEPKFFLSVGHAKIDYQMAVDYTKNNTNSTNAKTIFHSILENISENTRIQNNYIYCMFFFVANKKGIITHLSDLFIPCGNQMYSSYLNFRLSQEDVEKSSSYFLNTTDANPYLLTFPTGLALSQDKSQVFVSYGEGDCRPKIVEFSTATVQSMLKPALEDTRLTFKVLKMDGPVNTNTICQAMPSVCPAGKNYRGITYNNYHRHLTSASTLLEGGRRRRRTYKKKSIKRSS